MTLVGPTVLDIVQHFVERWNEIKKRKVCHLTIFFFADTHNCRIVRTRQVRPLFFRRACAQPMTTCLPGALTGFRYPTISHSRPTRPSPVRVTAHLECCRLFNGQSHNPTPSHSLVLGHPHRDQWQRMGRQFHQRFHHLPGMNGLAANESEDVYARAPHGTMNVQVVRSVSDWSHGVLTEKSIQNACASSRIVAADFYS